MGTRPTIIAFAIAVIAVVAAVIVGGTDAISESTSNARHALLGPGRLPVEKVQRITLQRHDQPAMVFERRGGQWWQTQPFEYPMNVFSIRQLIVKAVDLEYVSVIDPTSGASASSATGDDALAALSLHPANAVITYQWEDHSLGFELGRRGIAGRAYLRIVGEPDVYVVGQELHDRAVEMDPKEWRDRTIFRNINIDASRMERRNGDDSMVIEREQKQWKMTAPVATRAARSAMEDFIAGLARIEIGGYIVDQPEDLSRFGLDNPPAEFSITTEHLIEENGAARTERQTQTLLIGAPIGIGSQDRFGMIRGLNAVVRIRESVVALLLQDPKSLVDSTGSGAAPENVKRLRITTAHGDVLLERDLERWVAPDHNRAEVPYKLVQNLLSQICLTAAPSVEFKDYPMDLEVATITLIGYDRRPIDTVRLAREPDDGRWAMENGDNVLRIFPASMTMPLTASDFGLSKPPG